MKYFKTISKMAILAVMFLVITASSSFGLMNTYWELDTVGLGQFTNDDNTQTNVFNQILYYANINTIQYDSDNDGLLTVGDMYLSNGNVLATNLSPIPGNDTEGLTVNTGLGYEFTFVLSDLVGIVSGISPNITTTEGPRDIVINEYVSGTINLYIDSTLDATYNGTLDMSNDGGFNNGTLVAVIAGVHGTGLSLFESGSVTDPNPTFITGSYDIEGTFSYLLDNFWYDENHDDLDEKLVNLRWLLGTADGNIDQVTQDFSAFGTNDGTGDVLYTIFSDSNASFDLSAVPEPATCFLLGTGLIGLAGMSRRKFRP